MAKKSLIEKDKKRQRLFLKYKSKRKLLIRQAKDGTLSPQKLMIQLQKLPRDSSCTRLHNRCSITGRPKGYFRYFGLSRHVIREMAHQGFLPGVTKSSW
uniref:Small ribosomal subunit protein uS14c n=1 Tax=Prasinococcus sp. CCMP1194 TaxID=110672 RepID=A0A088CI73_9VIRI|nr:ribosomal protein S14 [Prasinococcus sp. CCMP1194]